MNILLIGLSYKTAPLDIRERLAFTPVGLRSALTHFDHTHLQAHLEDVREGVILSTCNRLEIYALVSDPKIAGEAIINLLSRFGNPPPALFSKYLYIYHNEKAVYHLLRVATGLDSLVVGEPQILGQITEAYEAALSQGAAGTVLSALFRAAIHTGKRVRTETGISVNPASISSVAAHLAGELLGDLSQQHVLLIGAGEMGEGTLRALIKRGVTKIAVANRTYKYAEQLASTWGGQAITFQQLTETASEADIIITATGAPHTILNQELLKPVMAIRPTRPLFIIDIAVPRNVDPNVTEIPNIYLRNIDDLQSQATNNLCEREAEIPRVELIIAEEAAQFLKWLSSLDVVSTIIALRQQIEQVRQGELERLFNRLNLDGRERAMVVTMSQRLANKFLHRPTLSLKNEAANGNGASYISAVRHLFLLDGVENQNELQARK